MKFDDQTLVQTLGSRFAVKGLTPGGKGLAQLFVEENGANVLKYSVTLKTLAASTDTSFKEVGVGVCVCVCVCVRALVSE